MRNIEFYFTEVTLDSCSSKNFSEKFWRKPRKTSSDGVQFLGTPLDGGFFTKNLCWYKHFKDNVQNLVLIYSTILKLLCSNYLLCLQNIGES